MLIVEQFANVATLYPVAMVVGAGRTVGRFAKHCFAPTPVRRKPLAGKVCFGAAGLQSVWSKMRIALAGHRDNLGFAGGVRHGQAQSYQLGRAHDTLDEVPKIR